MKRFMIYCLVVAFIAAIPLSHTLMAKKADKVEICHVNSANDVLDMGSFVVVFGRVIEVSLNAVNTHLKHGDSTTYTDMDEALRDLIMETEGIALPNANCYFIEGLVL